jgi:hypothetical protein
LSPQGRGDDERGALAMSDIPLHIQRKSDRRWTARFASPVASAGPKGTALNETINNLTRRAKAKEKPAELSKRA